MDQVVQPFHGITIDVMPRVARGFANERHNVLITGFVQAGHDVAEASLWADGVLCSRIVYGRESGRSVMQGEGAANRLCYEFAFNLIRPMERDESEIAISIVARTEEGAEESTDFTITIDPAERDAAYVARTERDGEHAASQNEFHRSPMLLYVEQALSDGGSQVRCSGWVVSVAQVLTVQMFRDDQRIGMAKTGFDRHDVAAHYPGYQNSLASGFAFNVNDADFPPGSPITLQAIARSGNAYEVVIPSFAWKAFPDAPATEAAPQPAPDPPPLPEPEPPEPAPPEPASISPAAPVSPVISLVCDLAVLSTAGVLNIDGWCLGQQIIAAIELRLDGTEIGAPELGRTRRDVADAYPDLPSAFTAGFRFSGKLKEAIDPERSYELLIAARDEAGNTKSLTILLKAIAALPTENKPPAAPVETYRLMIDSPAITGAVMDEPVRDRLFVDGWAIAQGGVRSIEVELNGGSLGPAFYGQRREDIANAFPDWNNALLSGFAFHLPARALAALPPGEHQLHVRLTTTDGETFVRGFSFIHEKQTDELGTKLFRREIPFVERQLLVRTVQATASDPTFNIFIVTDEERSHPERLGATLRSLQSQICQGWHATLIVGSDPEAADMAACLRELRIAPEQVGLLDARIPANRERALASFSHEPGAALYAVIRSGDELACDALAEMALGGSLAPDSDLFTCDDIRHDPIRGGHEPFHKPGWSPDLLLSGNYIGRFWCGRTDVIQRARVAIDDVLAFGDYDLLLRITEGARAIHHIPRLLFRQTQRSDSNDQERAALERAVARRGIRADILAGLHPGSHRVRRATEADPLISVIIPTAGAKGHIERCIASLRRLTGHAFIEILCIDNIPRDNPELKRWLRRNADQVIEINEAFNWSLFNNIAAARANGAYLLFLNDDTEVIDGNWLTAMLEHAQRPEVGVVGPQLLYPDGKVQHAGLFLTGLGSARHAFRFLGASEPGYFGLALSQRNVTAVTGACMLVRRDVFDKLRGFDEAHAVVNNDLDFCLRARREGLLVVYTPHASLIHHELASRAELKDDYHSTAFDAEWADVFAAGDPYYNPNLSRAFDDFRREDEVTELVHAGHPLYDRSTIRRILAVKLDHIGDFITALPAFRRLKQHFPNAELCVLASKAARHIAPLEPSISEVIEFEFFHARSGLGRKELTEEALRALRASLEPYAFDLAIDLRKHTETRGILRHTGARLLAGFDTQDENPFLDIAVEWEVDRKLHLKRQHVSDDLIRLVDAVAIAGEPDRTGIAASRRPPPLEAADLPPAARKLLRRPLAIIHPGVGQDTRQWPPGHFATLIDMLVERCGVSIALIGSPDEEELARQVMTETRRRKRVVSLVGKIPLADLPRLLTRAALYVGNNSGPKHIAAALGVPTIGIHSGVVDATEWGPLGPAAVAIRRNMSCSPCYIASLSQCFRHYACMRGLEPASVFAVCERMLLLGRPDP